MSKCIKCEYCNNALYAGIKCKNCGRVTEQAAIKRDLTPEQPAQQEPVADRENAIIRFALHQFMSNAYSHMNAAAQDKDNRHYTAGAVEKFTKDAKDAEALLSRLQFKAPQPAQQALDKMAENARELGLDYEPAPMSQPNRAIAYSAASKLRELGYEWVADAWKQPAQQQEPYGWHTEDHLTDRSATTYSKDVADRWKSKGWPVTPLYTSPQEQPSKPWVGLTPEQRATIAEANNMLVDDDLFDAIEAKLKEKNT